MTSAEQVAAAPAAAPPPSIWDTPLYGAPLAFIDFETTGIDPQSCHPVSVAVITCRLGMSKPELVYRSLIKCPAPIPAEATSIHHITDEMCAKKGREWGAVVRDIQAQVGRRGLVAYNLAYDWQIYARGMEAIGRARPEFGHLDPYILARAALGRVSHVKLVDSCQAFGVELGNAHDASADAMATALLLPCVLSSLVGDGHILSGWTIGELWAWTVERALQDEDSYAEWCKRKGRQAPSSPWHELTAPASVVA